jgi:hypothetical protein
MSVVALAFGVIVCLWGVSSTNEFIDPTTKQLIRARKIDGKILHLVMSDEFEEEGRRFESGHDNFFEAINQPDNTNQAMQYCKCGMVEYQCPECKIKHR